MKKLMILATVISLVITSLLAALMFCIVQDYQASRGDINHDGIVNIQDLSIMAKNFERGE